MLYERRKAERVKISLPASWEGVLARCEGEILDISMLGCFILTSDGVWPGELVRFDIQLPRGKVMSVWGEVVYQLSEMGFGVKFTHLPDDERVMLQRLIRDAKRKQDAAATAQPQNATAARL